MGRSLGFLVISLALCGCLPPATRDQLAHETAKDWATFKATAWGDTLGKMTGFNDMAPDMKAREAAADDVLCLHPRAEERVTRQEGIEDAVVYRYCPATPANPPLGQRLAPRG